MLATGLLAALASACGAPALSPPDASAAVPPTAPIVGRSVCPGSVPQVGTNLQGRDADTLERLGGTYQDEPGVLGVVWDGHQGVVVVEAGKLIAWQARLAPLGIAVARSCVDPTLLATVRAAFGRIPVPEGTMISGGYDALHDAISVGGVDTGVLLAAMEVVLPGTRPAALAAIANGTLRVDPQTIRGGRL